MEAFRIGFLKIEFSILLWLAFDKLFGKSHVDARNTSSSPANCSICLYMQEPINYEKVIPSGAG